MVSEIFYWRAKPFLSLNTKSYARERLLLLVNSVRNDISLLNRHCRMQHQGGGILAGVENDSDMKVPSIDIRKIRNIEISVTVFDMF